MRIGVALTILWAYTGATVGMGMRPEEDANIGYGLMLFGGAAVVLPATVIWLAVSLGRAGKKRSA